MKGRDKLLVQLWFGTTEQATCGIIALAISHAALVLRCAGTDIEGTDATLCIGHD